MLPQPTQAALKTWRPGCNRWKYFFEQKLKMVEAAIGHRKAIDELISEFQDEVDRMSKRLEDLAERRDVAQAESTLATNAETTLQNEYDLLTQYQQTVTAKLTDGRTCCGIMQADTVNDMPSMYFLVLELKMFCAIHRLCRNTIWHRLSGTRSSNWRLPRSFHVPRAQPTTRLMWSTQHTQPR